MLYNHLTRQAPLPSAASWFFEGYVHDWLKQGGSFAAHKLPIVADETERLEFQIDGLKSMTLNYFTTASNLAEQVRVDGGQGIDDHVIGKHLVPSSSNTESIGGLVCIQSNTLTLFKITLARGHHITTNAIRGLLAPLPITIKHIYLVSIVPQWGTKLVTHPWTYPTHSSLRPGAPLDSFDQFRLILHNGDTQLTAAGEASGFWATG